MNFYQGLLFLNGYLIDHRQADPQPSHYSTGYGNRVANARAFGKLGHLPRAANLVEADAATVPQPVLGCCG